jgi:hypothetical protein
MPTGFFSGQSGWSGGPGKQPHATNAEIEEARFHLREELLLKPWEQFRQIPSSIDEMPLVNGVGLAPDGRLVILTSVPLAAITQARPHLREEVASQVSKFGVPGRDIEWVYAGQNVPCSRPACGGDSVSSAARETGTIACMVEDSSGNPLLLGCSHVLAAPPVAGIGIDEHWQPGDGDGGTAADRIGVLHDYVPINVGGGTNAFDAALCLPDDPANCQAGLQILGAIAGCNATPAHNISVRKVGWQTPRVTGGTLRYLKLSHTLTFPSGVAIFDDQYGVFGISLAQPFAIPGDSGALVIDDQGKAVGMVFGMAQGTSIAYVSPIEPILNHFNVSIP